MTKTELLLIEARDIACRILGTKVSNDVIGQVFDVLVLERMPGIGAQSEDARHTVH